MMMDFFTRDDTMLVFYKKMLRQQGSVLLICLCFLVLNGSFAFNHLTIANGLAFGIFVCNTFWTLIFWCDLYSDYKLEKHRYNMIKELEDKHGLEKNIEFLKDKQKQYDSMIAELNKAKYERTN